MSTNEHYVFHPDDTVLKTLAWVATRPAGELHTAIEGKWPNFVGTMELAVGQGRNGKNAIKMTTNAQTQGDPAFWIMPVVSNGGTYNEPTSDDNFVVPPTKRANRIEAWFRFPPGYKEAFAAAMNYYSDAFHWGTYSTYLATSNDGSLSTLNEEAGFVEGNGHWYHQLMPRFDWLDDNEWVCITCNAITDHCRGENGRNNFPKNPTLPHADYFRCLTRSYLEFVPYWWRVDSNTNPSGIENLPGIATPYSIYCDSIRFYWRDEYLPVEIRFGSSGDWYDAQEFECAPTPTVTDIPFRVTNVTNASVTGRLAFRGRSIQWSPIIIDQVSSAQFAVATYTLSAGETKHFWLRVSPIADNNGLTDGVPSQMGIVFEPSTEVVFSGPVVDTPWGANMIAKTSSKVMRSAYHGIGAQDYDICCRSIGLVRATGGHTAYRPTSRGGGVYRVPPTVTSQFQLPGHIPDGSTLTFAKGNSQSGRGTLTIASSGVATYTPPSAGWTGTCHFSYQINGASAKPSLWYGAWVNVTPARKIAKTSGNKAFVGPGGGVVTI